MCTFVVFGNDAALKFNFDLNLEAGSCIKGSESQDQWHTHHEDVLAAWQPEAAFCSWKKDTKMQGKSFKFNDVTVSNTDL